MSHKYKTSDSIYGTETVVPDTVDDIENELDEFGKDSLNTKVWQYLWFKLWILTLRIVIAIFRSRRMPYGGE